jgi:hypothetical protein
MAVDHQQRQHERHEHERAEKRAEERRSEAEFSKPGKPALRPLWFLVAGVVLSLIALVIWMRI